MSKFLHNSQAKNSVFFAKNRSKAFHPETLLQIDFERLNKSLINGFIKLMMF